MLKSKAIRDSFQEDKPNILLEVFKVVYSSALFKPYREIRYAFRRLKKNYLFWKNVLRYDYNFDSHGLLKMINYKLETMYPVLENDYAIQENKDMKALRIAIKLSKRLWEDEYDDRTYRKIEAKYGKLKINWLPIEGSDCSQMISSYGGNDSEEYREKVHAEKVTMLIIGEQCKVRDERNLYAILLKYRQAWWS